MTDFIRAVVMTNSTDDPIGQVKISSDGIWDNFGMVMSVNATPLKKGDIVIVSVANGTNNPIILGKIKDKEYESHISGEVIAESQKGDEWSAISLEGSKIIVRNSKGMEMVIDDKVVFNKGLLGNIVSASNLVAQINKLQTCLESIQSVFASWNANQFDAISLKTAMSSVSFPSKVLVNDVIDPNILH